MPRILSRVLAVGGAAGLLVAGLAGPALAHVSVNSPGATQGGFAVLTFRVPNETENTDTVGLKVQLPADQPLGSVSVKPLPGWTYKVEQAKLATPITTDDGQVTEAPSVVTWTAATGNGIKPGEYNEFQLSVGPLPKSDQMVFKAIQTYSDGKTVDWIDEAAPGSTEEPEHPAPTLKLAAAAAGTGTPAPSSTSPTVSATPAASDGASSGSVTGAYVIAILGLIAGLAGLALGMSARRRGANVTTVQQPASVGTKSE
jgi:periplasmic copper chaperone A